MHARKITKAYDTLSIRVEPHLGQEVDLWAHRAGVSRSALGRYVFTEALARIRRRGRRWLREQIEGREADRDTTMVPDKGSLQLVAANGGPEEFDREEDR